MLVPTIGAITVPFPPRHRTLTVQLYGTASYVGWGVGEGSQRFPCPAVFCMHAFITDGILLYLLARNALR